MEKRGRIRAALLTVTIVAVTIGIYAQLLVLLVLAGCLFLGLIAECGLPTTWLRCKLMVCGGLAGGFLTILVFGCLLSDAGLRPVPRGELSRGDVFVAFGLGLGEDCAPGASNRAMAGWIVANNPWRLPTITQEGVYRALKELEKSQPDLAVDAWTIRLLHDPLLYVDTREATRQSVALLKEKGYRRPILVSHDLQLQRMAWHFEAAGFAEEVIVPEMPAIPFDHDSIQHWGTRSRSNWALLERYYSRPIMGRELWVWLATCLGGFAGAVAAVTMKNTGCCKNRPT